MIKRPPSNRRWKKKLKEWNSQNGGKTETENKERDILIDRAIKGIARNLVLETFQGIHKEDPS